MNASERGRRENELRDFLSVRLDLIEDGLSLIDTEYVLDNPAGAGGRIDLLARDAQGNLVVIELKRSSQSSRQALHELHKYVSLLISGRGLRLDQIRCILVSTDWHELLIPFARFLATSDIHVDGLRLSLGEDGWPTGALQVEIPVLESGLELCPVYGLYLYQDEESRSDALEVAGPALVEIGVPDHFMVTMNYEGSSPNVIYPFGLVVVLSELDAQQRMEAEERDPHEFEGVDNDDSPWLHEQIVLANMQEGMTIHSMETFSPDKFQNALRLGWRVLDTKAVGRYSDPLVWSESALISLAMSEGEKYTIRFVRTLKSSNRAGWMRLYSDLDYCLFGAGEWMRTVPALLRELQNEPNSEIGVSVYCPTDIIFGLAHLVMTNGDDGYIPKLDIAIRSDRGTKVYGGFLLWDGKTVLTGIDQTVGVVFEGGLMHYGIARTVGEISAFEERLTLLHGLHYRVLEFLPNPDNRVFLVSVGKDGAIQRTLMSDENEDLASWSEFVERNRSYLQDLAVEFDAYMYTVS